MRMGDKGSRPARRNKTDNLNTRKRSRFLEPTDVVDIEDIEFLRRFVTETERFAHFDIYGWQPAAAPGRPKGAVGQGARAILAALPGVLGL